MRAQLRCLSIASLVALVAAAPPALAQDEGTNIQAFSPAPGHDDFIVTHGTRVPKHLSWTAGLLLDYAEDPLVRVDRTQTDEELAKVVDSRVAFHLMGTFALYDRVDIGLVVPFAVQNSPSSDIDGAVFGDVRLVPKIHGFWFGEENDGVGLAFIPELTFPSGSEKKLMGDPNLTFVPRVSAEAAKKGWRGALNVGYRIREKFDDTAGDLTVNDEIVLSAGLMAPLGMGLSALADIYTNIGTQARDSLEQVEVPTEFVAGVRYLLKDPRIAFLGGIGTGITQGYGTAEFRFFVGASYQNILEEEDIEPMPPPPPPPPPEPEPEPPPPPPPEPEPEPAPEPPPPPPPPPPHRARLVEKKIEIDDTVQFEVGSSNLLPQSQDLLDDVAQVLLQNAQVRKVQIAGHTDSTGGAAKNKTLSQARAESVQSYLIDKGVAAHRLTAKGYGEERPIANNKTKAGREKNRRVEFNVLETELVETE